MFQRAGIDISKIQAAVAPTKKSFQPEAKASKSSILKWRSSPIFRTRGLPIHRLSRQGLKRFRFGINVKSPNGDDSRILIRDTWNTDILSELTPNRQDIVLYKHRFSGFYETELDAILTRLGVKHLIFTGCTTSACVESTIRDEGLEITYLCSWRTAPVSQ